MDTLSMITDRYGPRLTGSVEAQEAADWTVERLKEYGLRNVHLEAWGRSEELGVAGVFAGDGGAEVFSLARYAASPGLDPLLNDDRGADSRAVARTFSPKKAQDDLDKFIVTLPRQIAGEDCVLSIPILFRRRRILVQARLRSPDLAEMSKAPTPTQKGADRS